MRKNLVVICYNYALSKRIANILAERLDMRMFDMYEMFRFHNAPNTLSDVLRINGEAFVDKKMRGLLKDEFDFTGVIFVVDTKAIYKNQDFYERIKENNIILFLKSDFKKEFALRENINFLDQNEKAYFSLSLDELKDAENVIEKNLANVVVDVDELTYSEIKNNVLSKIESLLVE